MKEVWLSGKQSTLLGLVSPPCPVQIYGDGTNVATKGLAVRLSEYRIQPFSRLAQHVRQYTGSGFVQPAIQLDQPLVGTGRLHQLQNLFDDLFLMPPNPVERPPTHVVVAHEFWRSHSTIRALANLILLTILSRLSALFVLNSLEVRFAIFTFSLKGYR